MKRQRIVPDCPGLKEEFTLLLVGAVEDSDACRQGIFGRIPWRAKRARGLREALPLISHAVFPVVISERDLPDGTWLDVLEAGATRPHPPVLIVTSRLADDHLWAEVLNLGGYDVLTKPFNSSEVHRTLDLAWQHWQNCREVLATASGGSEHLYAYQSGRRNQA